MKILRVRDSFMFYGPGYQRMYCAGDLVDSEDPAVKGRENLFQPVEDFVQQRKDRPQIGLRGRVVERASAEPGERRTVNPLPAEPEKSSDKDDKGPARRTPTKADTTGPKGKQDGEV